MRKLAILNSCHNWVSAAPKVKFPIKNFCSKCDQTCSFLQIRAHLLSKSLMEKILKKSNFHFLVWVLALLWLHQRINKLNIVTSYKFSRHLFSKVCESVNISVAYSEPCKTSKMERLVKTGNSLKPVSIFGKRSILDVDSVLNWHWWCWWVR